MHNKWKIFVLLLHGYLFLKSPTHQSSPFPAFFSSYDPWKVENLTKKVKIGKRLRDWRHFTMDFSGKWTTLDRVKLAILICGERLTQLKNRFLPQNHIYQKFSSNQVRNLFCDFFKIFKIHGPRITSTQKLSLSCTWQLLLPVIISKRMCPWSTKS